MPDRERVRLILEALPSDVPAGRRLARLLKVMQRYYGFRLVEPVEPVEEARAAPARKAEPERERGEE